MSGWIINPWRDYSTAALLRERECRQFDLADLDSHPDGWAFAPESRAFLVWSIRQLNEELARRKRLAGTHGAPAMPSLRDRREELAEIKRRVSILDFLHHAAPLGELAKGLERRGRHDVWCCCPLPHHTESTPSFHVDEARDVWHCFGCGQGGDLFELARHLWGIGEFYEVVSRLRFAAGLEPIRPLPERPKPTPMRRASGQDREAFEYRGGRVVGRT